MVKYKECGLIHCDKKVTLEGEANTYGLCDPCLDDLRYCF